MCKLEDGRTQRWINRDAASVLDLKRIGGSLVFIDCVGRFWFCACGPDFYGPFGTSDEAEAACYQYCAAGPA
jgi:hypothetical protein